MSKVIRVDFRLATPDFQATDEEALYHAEDVLRELVPDGDLVGEEYTALNPTRDDSEPGSFKFNVCTGLWGDFATEETGVGFISYTQYVCQLDSPVEAAWKLAGIMKRIKAEGAAQKSKKVSKKQNYTPIVPVPEDAPPCSFMLPDLGTPTKLYAYRDTNGNLLMHEGRWEWADENGKKCKQILPISYCDIGNSKRGWRAKAIPKPWPLFQLDRIAENNDAEILVCEGSKKTRKAQSLLPTYVCTTPLFGARSPEHSNWDAVRNRDVTIWPDHDEAGREFANAVKKLALAAGARSVKILSIPKDFPEKWDAADAAAAGWTKQQALKFVQQNQREATERKGLKKVTLEAFLATKIKPREMIISPILPEKGAVMLHAYRGYGKTHVALGIGFAVATGTTFLKWEAAKPKRVLLLDGEMSAQGLQERLIAMSKNTTTKPPRADYFQIIAHDLQDESMPSLSSPEGQAAIDKHLEGVDLLILDNLSTLCPDVKENDADSWTPVQKWLLDLRRRGLAVLLIHHSGKGKMQRGTSRKEDILDTVITLDRPEDYKAGDGARFVVTYEKARGFCGEDADSFEAALETIDGKAVWHVLPVQDEKADKILELAQQRVSVRKIAEQMNMPHTTVQYRINKLKQQGKL